MRVYEWFWKSQYLKLQYWIWHKKMSVCYTNVVKRTKDEIILNKKSPECMRVSWRFLIHLFIIILSSIMCQSHFIICKILYFVLFYWLFIFAEMQFVLKLKNEKFVVNKDTMILNICVTFHWFNLDLEKKWREKNTIEYIIPNRISREKNIHAKFWKRIYVQL